jgi:hypothetical protein
MAHNINIDAVEARRDELTDEYAGAWRAHNEAISAIPARADLRDMAARRDAAGRDTAAAEDQRRIADELVEVAESCVEWAYSVLDSGDYSDGLDGMTDEELTRVMDRAIMRGKHDRTLDAARLLEASGDTSAMHRLAAQNDDVRVAMEHLDAYRDAGAILAPLRSYAVCMPDDDRIQPSIEVARRIADEDKARQADDLEVARERQARIDHASKAPAYPRSSVRRNPGGRRGRR